MRPSILALHLGAILFASTTSAAYALVDNYNASNFFTSFDFFTDADPTNGFTKYISAQTAGNSKLAGWSEGARGSKSIFMGTDDKDNNPSLPGRHSTRVHSKKSYTRGLFIADIKHMPSQACAVWPAFWTVGENWPNNGEIDILENVNLETQNRVTLHTSAGCVMKSAGSSERSTLLEDDCNTDEGRTGCGFQTNSQANYGLDFNNADGGVYAMEWTSDVIQVWHFMRKDIPKELLDAGLAPNPKTWGTPVAAFAWNGCDIDQHFKEHKIVFNTALCGDVWFPFFFPSPPSSLPSKFSPLF